MSILTVGAGLGYQTLSEAVAASAAGDVIQVQAGLYVDDFTTITHSLTIQGVGGMAHFVALASPPDGKAIMTVDADLSLDHLAFSGARVPDGNGAGLRYQGGQLSIDHAWFHDNQDGLLGGAVPGGRIAIANSEFDHNGTGTGQTHNLYVGAIDRLTVTGSYFHDVDTGHEIKSRAAMTVIEGNRLDDGDALSASYSIDLPDGGVAEITGNLIVKGSLAQNWTFVHFGGEADPSMTPSSLTATGNTVVSRLPPGSAPLFLRDDMAHAGSAPVRIADNVFRGLTADQVAPGGAALAGNRFLALDDPPPAFDVPAPGASVLLFGAMLQALLRRRRTA